MTRSYLFRGLLAVTFIASFWFGRDLSKTRLKPQAVADIRAHQDAKSASNDPANSNPTSSPGKKKTLRTLLREEPAAGLYAELFDNRRFAQESPRAVLREANALFRKRYPTEARAYERELMVRAGVLKAMGKEFKPGGQGVPSEEIYGFYRGLLTAEPWLVRREALKNIRDWLPTKSEEERQAVYRAAGERAVASIQVSDRELLEGVFHE